MIVMLVIWAGRHDRITWTVPFNSFTCIYPVFRPVSCTNKKELRWCVHLVVVQAREHPLFLCSYSYFAICKNSRCLYYMIELNDWSCILFENFKCILRMIQGKKFHMIDPLYESHWTLFEPSNSLLLSNLGNRSRDNSWLKEYFYLVRGKPWEYGKTGFVA